MVASIGPAGENKVGFASIQFDRNAHSFSRAGMGAVMGAKNLKAIVVQGDENIIAKNLKETKKLSSTINQCTKEFALPKLFTQYGTPMFINMVESLGLMYGENWRRKIRQIDITSLDIAGYRDAVKSKSHGCFRCPLKCGKHWRIKQGSYQGEEGFKYEVAYIMTLGLTLGIRDVPSILHLVNKLNRMGMDINEFCGTIGMATDALKQGILGKDSVDNLDFDWGSTGPIETAVDLTANRRGFGNILAEGTKKAAAMIGGGAEKYALHMKGMHWPAHSAPPFVMAFSVSTRGGDFLKAIPHLLLQSTNKDVCQKLFGAVSETMNIYSHEAKGRAVWWHENYKLLIDSLGICFYLGLSLLPHGRLIPDDLAVAYSTVTGIELNGKDLLKAAERSNQIERAINSFRGLDRKHDMFTKRPEQDSWAQGIDLNRSGMLDEYYAYRGLSQQGFQTQERLLKAELPELVSDLGKVGLIDHCLDSKGSLALDKIIKNPSAKDINRSLKAKIQNKLKRHIMGKLSQDPSKYREYFRKIGLKNRNELTSNSS
jgi:aldehyde:ferredoxin oxidoreductase